MTNWFSSSYVRKLETRTEAVAKEENADLDSSVVLMHGVRDGARLDYAVYDTRPVPPPSAPANLMDAVYVSCYCFSLLLTLSRLRTWNLVVFLEQEDEVSCESMIKLDFVLSGPDVEGHSTFSGTGINMYGISLATQGKVQDGLETPIISFSIKAQVGSRSTGILSRVSRC
jgi:hypothetical protein